MIWINLEKKELTKKRTFTKYAWYDQYGWLINYIPELIKKYVDGVKDQIMSQFNQGLQKIRTWYGGGKKQS